MEQGEEIIAPDNHNCLWPLKPKAATPMMMALHMRKCHQNVERQESIKVLIVDIPADDMWRLAAAAAEAISRAEI